MEYPAIQEQNAASGKITLNKKILEDPYNQLNSIYQQNKDPGSFTATSKCFVYSVPATGAAEITFCIAPQAALGGINAAYKAFLL